MSKVKTGFTVQLSRPLYHLTSRVRLKSLNPQSSPQRFFLGRFEKPVAEPRDPSLYQRLNRPSLLSLHL